jgi:hypothetical protein
MACVDLWRNYLFLLLREYPQPTPSCMHPMVTTSHKKLSLIEMVAVKVDCK